VQIEYGGGIMWYNMDFKPIGLFSNIKLMEGYNIK
jgi:hypothetical protein